MATVSDVARRVIAAVGSSAGPLLVGDWVTKRYEHVVARTKFRHLRRVGELVVPATITAGTVTATRGSRFVTADATALAAWSSLQKGWWFRGAITWYLIEDVTATGLTLQSAYAENGASGIAYVLAPRVLTLADDARWLGTFVHMRRRVPLSSISMTELDQTVPERPWATAQAGPDVIAEIGSRGGPRRVEAYPYPAQAEVLHYAYWSLSLSLDYETELPLEFDTGVLVEGALIDAMRYEASQAARASKVELAAYWRNEYRAQETSWQRWVQDAARADRGVDDATFILQQSSHIGTIGRADIKTAHDDVSARWDW